MSYHLINVSNTHVIAIVEYLRNSYSFILRKSGNKEVLGRHW